MNTLKENFSNKWFDIDWEVIAEHVSQLQTEISLAKRNNDKRYMFKKQRELIHSFEGRAYAVHKATTTDYGFSSSSDYLISSDKAAEYYQLIIKLKTALANPKRYVPAKVERPKSIYRTLKIVPDMNNICPINLPPIRDRCLQMLHLLALDPVVEEISDETSFGFRKHRSTNDVINRIIQIFRPNPAGEKWSSYAWEMKIENCFDNIDHQFLENKLEELVYDTFFYKKWLKGSIKAEKGVVGAGFLAPVFVNITLNGMLDIIRPHRRTPNKAIDRKDRGKHFIRYLDNCLFTARTEDSLKLIMPEVVNFLRIRGLTVMQNKFKIVHINKGFEFILWNVKIRKSYHKPIIETLLVRPVKASLIKIRSRIDRIINDSTRAGHDLRDLISVLDPVLRDWANYYRINEGAQLMFDSLGSHINRKIYSFLYSTTAYKRGNSHDFKKFIEEHFIVGLHSSENLYGLEGSWISPGFGKHRFREDKVLVNLSTLPINCQKYPLQLNRNAYIDLEYFDKRTTILGFEGVKERVFKEYNGKCAFCQEKFLNYDEIVMDLFEIRKYGPIKYRPLHKTCSNFIYHQGVPSSKKYRFFK